MAGRKSPTGNGAQLGGLVLLFCAVTLGSSSLRNGCITQSHSKFLVRIDSTDVSPESTLPRRLRNAFDGRLKARFDCVSVDLNDDGESERFATLRFFGGNGACPWFIFDPEMDYYIASFDASIIYVLNDRQNGYHSLECLYQKWNDSTSVVYYSYDGSKYHETRTIRLQGQDIAKFFEERKRVPHPWELRPGY